MGQGDVGCVSVFLIDVLVDGSKNGRTMTYARLRCSLLTILFLCPLVGEASAQARPFQQRLAAATKVQCEFSMVLTGTWTDGVPQAASKPARLTVGFANVNVDEGTADAQAAMGGSFVVVRHSHDYLHLMQTHSAGPLYTTTVFARESKDGRMIAVHTRHEYTDVAVAGFTSRPETYLGDCAVE